MNGHDTLLTLLARLDAADPGASAETRRARADLERILTLPTGASAPRGRAPRRPRRRLVVAAASVAAVAVGASAGPVVVGGDEAFASWRAVPGPLSGADRTAAAESCRDAQRDGAGAAYRDRLLDAATAVADRRGDWTTVVLAGRDGFSALCVTDASSHLFGDFIGSVGLAERSEPAPRELIATDLGAGSMRAGQLSLAVGLAGADVAAVSYQSARHGRVVATVASGRFALWFPGGELHDASGAGAPMQVTFRDGSTATVTLRL